MFTLEVATGDESYTLFLLGVGAVSLVAGAVAAMAGFGIGSILTPVLALEAGLKLAVVAVGIPHFVGSLIRFWFLRRHLDRQVLMEFGIASAVGGLAGALLHTRVSSPFLTFVFGGLLMLAGISELTGWMRRGDWAPAAGWGARPLS